LDEDSENEGLKQLKSGNESEEEEEDSKSEYSDVHSDRIYKYSESAKLVVKINEQFTLLLMLFMHNLNERDLAF
jgi:hypothetical protein